MEARKSILFMILMVVFAISSVHAQLFESPDFVEGGIGYKILEDGASVAVHINNPWSGIDGTLGTYNVETVTIPSRVFSTELNKEFSVKKINDRALWLGHEYVKNITIPESVESIGKEAFASSGLYYYYDSYHGVSFAQSARDNLFFFNAKQCESIGENAFCYGYQGSAQVNSQNNIYYCYFRIGNEVEVLPTGLPLFKMEDKILYIPDNVRTIKSKSLYGTCNTLVIGKGVSSDVIDAFGNLSASRIYSTSEVPPVSTIYYVSTLYVPVGSLEAYQSAPGWNTARQIIEKDYVAVQSLDLGFNEITIYKGETLHFDPKPYPTNSTAFEDGFGITKMIAQNVESPDHIIHLNNNEMEATEVGSFDVTAYVDTVIAKCRVNVVQAFVQGVDIQMNEQGVDNLVIKTDDVFSLQAKIYPSVSEDISDYTNMTWTSTNPQVATVTDDGIVTGCQEGECDIAVTISTQDQGNVFSDVCHIVVDNVNAIVNITPSLADDIVNVYNMQGQVIRRGVMRDTATHGLPQGIYVVGNKKVVVR